MTAYTIREATRDDAQALHELGAAVTIPTYAPIAGEEYARFVMETWWRTDYIAESMGRTTHYLAERDHEILGTAVVGDLDGEPVLWKLYVLPSEHGSGIGSALLETAIGGLPDDVDRLLLSYLDGNEHAAAFYRAKGFTYVRSASDAGGVTNHWMGLALPRT
ncbi:GNAT family N-acetyltransferase [Solicola gregarius]|uniref:GNAT family N-acetyltransferase n=1 Tax=Solicola gregarius TaxID=2908642 RepID=A0AA46TFN6_9ACTN|nr:GNAT family N-acetyltransferase [Solicola gregarius]UYM04464.1 GNAT family N-acetyltransferase [Solicola gregarius]